MRLAKILLAALAATLLAACDSNNTSFHSAFSGEKTTEAAASIPASQPVSIAAIREHAKGFQVGSMSMMRSREVFVFFDPQCPFCGQLWADTQPMLSEARFTWIPIAILRPVSARQGGAILTADNPAALMTEHEQLLLRGRGGIDAPAPDRETMEILRKNTALFESFGGSGVPYIVGTHARTGALVSISGALSREALATQLGW